MRYDPAVNWEPVSFEKRVHRAGWKLLFPPVFLALQTAFVLAVLWLVRHLFPALLRPERSWTDHPIALFLATTSILGMLVTQELAIMNGGYVTLDEMVISRLRDLEADAMKRHLEREGTP